ncbi:MAG: electron transport complex subunit RsxC [Synergistaceae bacterium]|jgi:electron transport complex protein RnfC|nr:electron transport complex subunit RsxC [Synergistaceae bacterium]
MSLSTFRGGIHPPESKSQTEKKEIEVLEPKGELVFPMSQHLGVPCSPIVKKGDRVLVGQKIADSEAFVSAPILSSVSGAVKEIGTRMTISGAMESCVIIDSDGKFEHAADFLPHRDFRQLDKAECLRIIRAAGLVGMGGATFPTHVKLSPPPDKKIRWIIVNGAECEPFLNCDNRLMVEHPEPIIGGLEICLHLFPDAEGVIAIEKNKPDAISRIGAELSERSANIRVMPHNVKYPQGAEKMLIYTVTGQEIPPGALPADVGCLVLNVSTISHIWHAITDGIPVLDRVISVVGDVVKNPKNIMAPLGVSVRELVDASGGFTEEPAKVLSGGPMMGIAMRSLDVPIVKGTSGVLALSSRSAPIFEESNCIRCGRCATTCPMGLQPSILDRLVRARDYATFEAAGGMNCIECGSCTYACPSRRYLTQLCRDGKAGVMAERRRQKEKGENR